MSRMNGKKTHTHTHVQNHNVDLEINTPLREDLFANRVVLKTPQVSLTAVSSQPFNVAVHSNRLSSLGKAEAPGSALIMIPISSCCNLENALGFTLGFRRKQKQRTSTPFFTEEDTATQKQQLLIYLANST